MARLLQIDSMIGFHEGTTMLIDSTLREGLQARGVYLDGKERAELASLISGAGVRELEIGWAGRGEDLREAVAATLRAGARPLIWSMARRISLEESARTGTPAVTVCVPASQRHQQERFGLDSAQVEDWLFETVSDARKLFDFVQVGLEDASRANRVSLGALAKVAHLAGADRLRIADTVGLLSPSEVAKLVRDVKQAMPLPLCVHMHNDLGMATANSVAALEAGAYAVDTTLLGKGERSGIACTEEVAAWGVVRQGAPFDLQKIRLACQWFATVSKFEIASNKAVAGEGIFSAESGIHVDALGRDPSLYEPWSPERTGHVRHTELGAKSGRAAVRRKLHELGLSEPVEIDSLVDEIRLQGSRLRRPLREDELRTMVGESRAD